MNDLPRPKRPSINPPHIHHPKDLLPPHLFPRENNIQRDDPAAQRNGAVPVRRVAFDEFLFDFEGCGLYALGKGRVGLSAVFGEDGGFGAVAVGPGGWWPGRGRIDLGMGWWVEDWIWGWD